MEYNIVDEIKSRCNIIDVIERSVKLKRTGSNMVGLCPFHNEKTPSFVVNEEKQYFNCYGCGAHGDVIEFVQRYNNLNFLEATEKLAEELGIEIKKSIYDNSKRNNEYYTTNREAAKYYFKIFQRQPNKAYDYMISRGIDDDTLKIFGVGYADESWTGLYEYLVSKGIKESMMKELGLVSVKDRAFDKYRDRVIFPIINTRDKVIGFGGRSLTDALPKYINSSESRIFNKKNNLYAINLAKNEIRKEDKVILVEGYMDVISLYQYGIKNVVATLGTALTPGQAKMLKRYTANIILSYDSDAAGQSAALRGIEVLNEEGCNVNVLDLGEGRDPDDFIREEGKKKFTERISQALTYTEYKIKNIKKGKNFVNTDDYISYIKEVSAILKELSPVEAEIYIKKIARQENISEGAMRQEIFAEFERKPLLKKENKSENKSERKIYNNSIEKYIIKLGLTDKKYFDTIKAYKNEITTPSAYRIFETLEILYSENQELEISILKDSISAEDMVMLNDILDNIHISDKGDEILDDCLTMIELQNNKERQKNISELFKTLDEDSKLYIEELMDELLVLQRREQELKGR